MLDLPLDGLDSKADPRMALLLKGMLRQTGKTRGFVLVNTRHSSSSEEIMSEERQQPQQPRVLQWEPPRETTSTTLRV